MKAKYIEIVNALRDDIAQGRYNSERKLPTEEALMAFFGVSRNTIRKAVDVLVNSGCVYRVQGSGVFLRNINDEEFAASININGLTKNFSRDEIKSKILELTVISPDDNLINKLECTEETKIYYVKRVRYVNDEPIEIEESYYNKDIIPYLNKEICEGSIFNYIREDLKINIGFANRVLSCNKLGQKDAEIMRLSEGDPCLEIENVVALNNGKKFNYSRERYNYLKVKLFNI